MLLGQLSRAAASAGRIHGVLATEPAIEDHASAGPLPPGPGRVEFDGVGFGYGGATSGARRPRPGCSRRSSHRAGGRHRVREDDGGASHSPFLRRHRGLGADRRHRRARGRAARRPPGGGHRLRRHVPLLGHGAQQHRVRRSRGNPRTGRAGGAARRCRRVRTRSPRRIRDRRRRTRVLALRWSTSAHRDRARGARRPAHLDPRRRDVIGRPEQGARNPYCARAK